MTYSGATQFVESARTRLRARASRWPGLKHGAETAWLLTLATIILIDQLARHRMPVIYPFPVLLFTVVVSAYLGGLRTALISAVLTVLYGIHFFAEPGLPLRYQPSSAYSLLVVGLVAPGVAILVSRLRAIAQRGRQAELGREEAEALDRRVSFLSQASSILASSLDYEVTFRELSRMLVPTVADWCAIHAIGDGGVPRFVAAAHRDPARDLLVRLLCEYGERRIPFGAPRESEPEPVEVTEEMIRSLAQDDEHRTLYRSLRPASVMQVPLHANGRLAGAITLVMSREYGRRFGHQDTGLARELGDRAALAIGVGHVFHEAREADRRYRLLFDANPQPMWVFDATTLEFLAVNEAAIRHYGYSREEFLSMNIMDIHPAEEPPGLPMTAHPSRQEAAFTRHQRKDGTLMDVELVSHELEIDGRRARLVLATDISDRARTRAALHQSEEQLRQAQRFDAVGRMADGVAHDFNNILTTIRGFGQQQAPQPRLLDLHAVVASMEGLIRRLLGADIRLDLRLFPGPAMLRMDPGHLDQLLVNIILNARDEMPQGGTLTIETAERQIGAGARARRVRPGPYVLLAIRDTGKGLDDDARSQDLEPVQPADPRQQRAGLGLSIVHGIVRQNGGVVRLSSEPGQGTTVKVYLPTADRDPVEAEKPSGLRGTETVER